MLLSRSPLASIAGDTALDAAIGVPPSPDAPTAIAPPVNAMASSTAEPASCARRQFRPAAAKRRMAYFTHVLRTRPQFIAYAVKNLPAAVPLIARHVFGLPLLTWTVRSEEDRRQARRWADQMIFEGWRP